MRALTLQFSLLIGILTFVSQITSGMALDSSLLRGIATASAIFLVMLLGDLAVQVVVRSNAPPERVKSRALRKQRDPGDRSESLAA